MQQERPSSPNWTVPFFTIWSGQAFSLLGSRLAQFALVWWLTKETGSATVLASATLVAYIPQVFLGPFVGALVDRWDRRRVMIVADSFIALAAVGLVYLFWADAMQIWHVYLIMLIRSIGGTFHWPAMTASTSLMVPRQHLSRIQGLNQTLQGMMNIAAPPLGALLMELLPLHGVMAIDVFTAILAILPLFFMQIPRPQREVEKVPLNGLLPALLKDVRSGLAYIWNWPGLFILLIGAVLINFSLSPAFSLLPILVTEHFGGEALELGWLQSAQGAGIVLGGLILSAWGGFRRRVLTSFMGLIGVGLGVILLGLTPATAFWLAIAGIFFAGTMLPLANGPLHAVAQTAVAPEMQGRVFTVMGSMSTAMTPIGLAIAGPVADWLGLQVWFLLGGALCLLMGIVSFFIPAVVHLEDGQAGGNDTEKGVESPT
jgi:DHA3 family macrolide efflux protein-like MFS transporter